MSLGGVHGFLFVVILSYTKTNAIFCRIKMNTPNFSLEFGLDVSEIQKLNKMYFKHLYKERILALFSIILFFLIFIDLKNGKDLIDWIIRSLLFVVLFLMIQYSVVNSICKIIFRLAKRLLQSENFINKYRFNFTNTFIYVQSPLGRFKHKWSKIEKAMLTKDFFFLYVKERNGYIISIANNARNERDIEKLVAFVENNVTHVTKV
ncbi:YcxB-like protein [Flavobacterium sp. CF108]|nr:YcxB-like protein [Flavobacterium sp. fv08]SHI07069.1 YcxB-like protein [Flavobacterium sp. CF108]